MPDYGYARVSTVGQDHAAQVEELKAAGCDKIFSETVSGAGGRKRPQLAAVLARLEPGDVLTVTRLDRLARSAADALNLLAEIARRGAAFRSLRETWADTTTAGGRLMVTVMAGLAEFERELIMARTSEGRAAAKARGVRMGRPAVLSGSQMRFVIEARERVPPMTVSEISAVTGASRSTVCRVMRAHKRGQVLSAAPPRQVDLEDVLAAAPESAD